MGSQPISGSTQEPAPESAVQRVINELETLVFGDMEPGAALPSESKLAEELGVSRLTVREAVKSLQARGLVDVHHGRRPAVAQLSAGPIGDFFTAVIRRDPRSLVHLLEVRRALEVHIAALAANRADEMAVQGIRTALEAMQEVAGDPDRLNEADVRFHESIAAATGNQILRFLIEAMAGPLRTSRLVSLRGYKGRGREIADLIQEHARILEYIEAADASGAAAAMQVHLSQTERSLRAAMSLEEAKGNLESDSDRGSVQ